MAEASEVKVETTTATISVNRGYPASWQGILKILKVVSAMDALVYSMFSGPVSQLCRYHTGSLALCQWFAGALQVSLSCVCRRWLTESLTSCFLGVHC